jgi:hypothetical protein
VAHPPEVQALADELALLYRNVQDSLIAELERIAADTAQRRYRRRLNEQVRAIDQALDQVDTQARVYLSRRFPEVYQLGALEAARATGRPWTWSQLHTDAVSEIANHTYADLLSATRYVRRDVKRFVRMAVRERTAFAVIGGQTATQAGRDLARTLAENRITAVRYRDGSRHTLGEYTQMVARTETALAYNAGTINASREAGVRYMRCLDGPACSLYSHNDGPLASGMVFTIEEANSYPTAHPNCARSWSPEPGITSDAEAQAARQYTPAEQERLAAEERERARTHTVQGRLTARERQRRERLRARERRLAARQRKVRT